MPRRLAGWDYATNAAYFVTVVTYQRRVLFGHVVERQVVLNQLGELVVTQLLAAVRLEPCRRLDAWVVMPDHVHVIARFQGRSPHDESLPTVIARFKAGTTYAARRCGRYSRIDPLWQRGFYDRVIRSNRELEEMRDYIASNPSRWAIASGTGPVRRTKSDGYTC
jgi:putative transposase